MKPSRNRIHGNRVCVKNAVWFIGVNSQFDTKRASRDRNVNGFGTK